MSQGSWSSQRRCRCGAVLNHFTAWTENNAGRRFWKCPRFGNDSCGYFEWEDDIIPDRALVVIRELKAALDATKVERDNLKQKLDESTSTMNPTMNKAKKSSSFKEKVDVLDTINMSEVNKFKKLEEKLFMMKMFAIISWAIFVGFATATFLK